MPQDQMKKRNHYRVSKEENVENAENADTKTQKTGKRVRLALTLTSLFKQVTGFSRKKTWKMQKMRKRKRRKTELASDWL